MFRKITTITAVILSLTWMAACTPAGTPEPEAGMPNPASVYCVAQGGQLEIRSSDAGETGVCRFDDGSECDEWAYYRGECAPAGSAGEGQSDQEGAELPNPASVHCQEQGGRLEIRTDASGQYGVCLFDDGSECDEWAYFRGECAPGESADQGQNDPGNAGQTEPAETEPTPPAPEGGEAGTPAVAWYGFVVSGDGGDRLVLHPKGAGELALAGDSDQVQDQIAQLRDQAEPGRNAHFWGTVSCAADDCTLLADRIRPDGPGPFFPPDPVEGWQGRLTTMRTEPGSGPDDAFLPDGGVPVQYGVWSEEPALAAQLESLRDTGQVFRIWGELTAGVPDANGTQIVVRRIELVD